MSMITMIPPHLTKALLPITIGVTGHRDIHPDDLQRSRKAVRAILMHLVQSHPTTPLRLLSPLAEGADRLVADVFVELRLQRQTQGDAIAPSWELVVPLPLPEELYRADFPATVDAFEALKAQAREVITLPLAAGLPLNATNISGLARDQQYEACGSYVARHSNLLIALWDGVQNGKTGGTGEVVNLKLTGIAGHHRGGVRDHDVGPVYHVPVRRVTQAVTPVVVATNQAGYLEILPHEVFWSRTKLLESFAAIERYNQALLTSGATPEALETSRRYLSPPDGILDAKIEDSLGPLEARMVAVYTGLDTLSVQWEARRKAHLIAMYVLAGLTAFCLWTALEGVWRWPMVIGYVVSFVVVALLFRKLRDPRISEDRLYYRAFAEAIRVQLYWSIGALPNALPNRPDAMATHSIAAFRVTDGFLRQQLHEIGWVRESLRMCGMSSVGTARLSVSDRKAFVGFWVEDQLKYFRQTEHKHIASAERLGRFALYSYVVGVLLAIITILFDTLLGVEGLIRHFTSIGAASAPAFALLLQGFVEKLALDEQAKNMFRMTLVFDRAQRRREMLNDEPATFNAWLLEIGQEAIAETINWLILKKSKPAAMPT